MNEAEKGRLLKLCESWLAKSPFKTKTHSHPNFYSIIGVQQSSGIEIRILQAKDDTDAILVTSVITLDADTRPLYDAWPKEKQDELVKKIQRDLLIKGVQFIFDREGASLKSLRLERLLYGEGLKKQLFFDTIAQVHEATILTFNELSTWFGTKSGGATTTTSGSGSMPYG